MIVKAKKSLSRKNQLGVVAFGLTFVLAGSHKAA